ncbi:HK97 family phage prohead protease [Microbacterium trichothecenolyticum]|uniref:HK97 family phage prohead protease n=1 Tax=Microbacterium trichothecenolyticum TaxID=69370 RepID=UPI0028582ABF|nr:HK97 family phage prohead protease [Microbacterium trichothecenolyticum]MDR7113888.1 HK97 family phage prohead protease [Microbacterium trichothecenolyticum]
MTDAERRFTSVAVEIRSGVDTNKLTIGGYAAKFDRMSQNLGGFVERIAPGFFNKSRGDGWPGVLARYNHDDNMVLGTIGGGTLRLGVDEIGLTYDVDLPQARADVYELVQRGDVRQSSFAFAAYEDDWTTSDQGFPLRTLVSGRLYDVAPVNTPAYEDTSVGARSIDGALASLARKFEADVAEVRSLAQAGELTRFFKRTDGPAPQTPRSAHEALAKALSLK